MVGIPGTEERLALAGVEDRLRRIRARFNLYTLQHNFYSFGAVCALGIALLIIGAFTFSPLLFTLISWPLAVLLAFLLLVFVRRGWARWADLNTAARRIDSQAGLKERLSTLVAQLSSGVIGKPPPSSLWPHLVADNTARLPDWEVKKVAPSRIPWSFLPFLAALLIALCVALIPVLSPSSEPDPFSWANIQTILSELPDRTAQLLDRQLSLLPDSQTANWGGSSVFDTEGDKNDQETSQLSDGQQDLAQADGRQRGARSLAALPEELQKAIRQALQGLPNKERDKTKGQDPTSPPSTQLALRPSNEPRQPDFSITAKNLPKGAQQQPSARGHSGNGKDGPPSGKGSGKPVPAQGSGIQQLNRARLDRKNTRGSFQPEAPQIPGSAGQSGEGGPGAGSGTDPRLFGNQAKLGGGANTFQLSLDATHEKGGESETEEEEVGSVVEKSSKQLSRRQSLDDAIRKSQIPAEYEDIVKRLFSRGESQ